MAFWIDPTFRFPKKSHGSLLEAKGVANMLNYHLKEIQDMLSTEKMASFKMGLDFFMKPTQRVLIDLVPPRSTMIPSPFSAGIDFGDIVMMTKVYDSNQPDLELGQKTGGISIALYMSVKGGLWLLNVLFVELKIRLSLLSDQISDMLVRMPSQVITDHGIAFQGFIEHTIHELQEKFSITAPLTTFPFSLYMQYLNDPKLISHIPIEELDEVVNDVYTGNIESGIKTLAERRNAMTNRFAIETPNPSQIKKIYDLDKAGHYLWELQVKRNRIQKDENKKTLEGQLIAEK